MIKVEEELKSLMLQNVTFKLDNKIIKRGKIRVFNTKQFFIKFKLDNGGDIKEFEIPYPYKLTKVSNGYLFDYCLSAFIPNTEEVFWKMKTLNTEDASKLYEKYLLVTTLSA